MLAGRKCQNRRPTRKILVHRSEDVVFLGRGETTIAHDSRRDGNPGTVPQVPQGAGRAAPRPEAARQARPLRRGPADDAARLLGPGGGARRPARGPGRLAAADPGQDAGRRGQALRAGQAGRRPGAVAGGRPGPFRLGLRRLAGRRPDLAQRPGRAERGAAADGRGPGGAARADARGGRARSTARAGRSPRSPSGSAEVSRPSPRCCVGAWKSCETG